MAEPEAPAPARPSRLADEEVRARLDRLEETLALMEQTPGPGGELGLSAVTELAHVYGEALARAVDHAVESGSGALLDALVRDELIGHLLVLHEIHLEPLELRVERAVANLRPAIEERGVRVELREIEHGVATLELTVGGCGSSAQGLSDAVREAVLDLAPDLAEVSVVLKRPTPAPAFVPLAGLSATSVAP
jgi:Fe-S cluster biogenesis protein NfuA